MAIMGLNLPTDIPWEQICVTSDMMARDACEKEHPPKWQSSIAVSRYVPDEEYQVYPERRVTYLKVTCSITGYQPRDKEVEGRLNFSGVGVHTVSNIDSLLEAYLPCTGALIQVAVSPPPQKNLPLDQYPYFMDFQPKKRELYEMVTETGERSSRSVEELRVGKASGTSESLEVLDIDQGSSSGGSAGVSVAGWGVNGSYQQANQGQWGTKQVGNQESSVSRSTDESRERRETESHTTQLSQLYHLLDSYHSGTNRALFFVQPRPHVLEVPTGFVRGPRGVDGIQEFFLVVNQPRETEGFVVSVRLDTSHLTVVPVLDYDRSQSGTVNCKVSADMPSRNDPPAPRETQGLVNSDGDRVGTIYYNCYKRTVQDSTPYTPPAGFRIDVSNNGGYFDQVNLASHGTSSVDVDPSGGSLTVHCSAESHICIYEEDDIDFGFWTPDNVEQDAYKWTAFAQRDVLVHLVSKEPTKKTGEKNVLVITTRQLCCGDTNEGYSKVAVADVVHVLDRDGKSVSLTPRRYAVASLEAPRPASRESVPPATPDTRESEQIVTATAGTQGRTAASVMSARDANELSDAIRDAMIQSIGSRRRETSKPVPYIDTDLFHLQLRRELQQTREGREALSRQGSKVIGADIAKRLGRAWTISAERLTCARIASHSVEEISQKAGINLDQARELKLRCLGVTTRNVDEGSTQGRA